MTPLETHILERIEEARGAVTFVLATDGEVPSYRPGQFLTVDPHQFPALAPVVDWLEALKERRELVRAYSLCSTPDEPHLAFTVKEEPFVRGETPYPPLLSAYLVHALRVGDPLTVKGFSGAFVLREAHLARSRRIVHLCAGSGIVPSYAILKDVLAHHPDHRQVLLYSTRTWDDVIYRVPLDRLAAAHPDRLEVRHALTRQAAAPEGRDDVRVGRFDRDDVARAVGDPSEAEVFVCGPGSSRWERQAAEARGEPPPMYFVETLLDHLHAIGVPAERVHKEVYG